MAYSENYNTSPILEMVKTACYQESQPLYWVIDDKQVIQHSEVHNYLTLIHQQNKKSFHEFCISSRLENPIQSINFSKKTITLSPISRWKNKNTTRYFKFQAQFIDDSNQCLLIAFDITQNIELDDSQLKLEFLQNIIDHLPYHLFWKDEHSTFLGCNRVFAKQAGFNNPDEIIGKTDYDLPWDRKNSDIYILDDQQVIRSQQPKLNIEEIMQVNNHRSVLLTSKVPLIKQGKTIGIIGIFQDITERKNMENELSMAKSTAEKALNAKSQLLATVSHELRTPLHGILGITQIIEDTHINANANITEHTSDIKKLAHSLLLLVNDLLSFTQYEKYDPTIKQVTFSCDELAESLVKQTQHVWPNNSNIDVCYHVDHRIPHRVIGDELRIRQILHNLLGNAHKFTQAGKIAIEIDLVSETHQSAIIRFSVNDSGIGIPEELQQKIFSAFYQVNQHGTSHAHKGIGLGLSISQQLCKSMGSELLVISQENMGSEFHFTLTLDKAEHAQIITHDTHKTKRRPSLGKNIFIIEDDAINQKVMIYFLKEIGCQFAAAHSGADAIDHLCDHPNRYDTIILDIGLPDISGLDLIHTIQQETGYTNTPIIILTAQVLENKDELFIQHPMLSSIITKPTSIQPIYDAIQKATSQNTEKTSN